MMVMVSPTGARLTKADHPALPMSLDEIVEATVASAKVGANALHLHVRDADGAHSIDAGLYREALAAIEAALPGFPVQVTTESAGRYTPADQLELLETLAPKWASISLAEVARDPDIARRVYDLCRANETEVQHIIYGEEDAELLRNWQAEGVLGNDESVILVLGRYAEKQLAQVSELEPLLSHLPQVGRWMLCAFGATEHACLTRASELGGDVRVGFENSITREDGQVWPTVADSVAALTKRIGRD
jgi:uncharacterized protein (DUF849 family)